MDNVHVAIRVRPLIKRENDASSQILWQCDKNSICQTGSKSAKPYIFDRVFGPDESTDVVYKDIAQPIIQASMNGYDGTIFAYGQTSSGKTHTMQGDANELGIIPKAINELFEIIENTPQREFLFRVSYMEIYNEVIKDLLQEHKSQLVIRENEQRRVYVSDLHEAFVTDPDEVLELMRIGNERRHIGQTNMNEHSSRSHTIFKVIIESRERRGEDETADLAVNCSELNLVDLAGSERANDTKADGVRLKEAGNINRSLFALCNVISRLSARSDFIPFRDSKLTRILQSALGGNAKTAVVCTVTPVSLDQTESTLQFASRAKTITNKPKINEILTGEAQIQRFQKEIQSLKQQVEYYKQNQEMQPQILQGQQDQERIAKLEEETLSQQQKINQLEKMILVSKTDQTNSPSESKVAKRKRRETWCPGALKRKAMYTPVSNDLVPRRDIFRPTNSFFAEVMSLPSNSPSSMSTFNDSQHDTSFNDDDAPSKLQSSPVLKRSKNVRWADYNHVSTQTEGLEEPDDKEERLQEVIGICEGVVNEKEKMEEQIKLTNMELLNLNQVISKLEFDKSQMLSQNENLRKEIEEAQAVKSFEEDEKAMWKLEESELLAKVSAMEEQVAAMKRKVDATDQSKGEMEILHNLEKERQERRVKELESQLQLAYDELNDQREASSEVNQREGKVRELEAERDLLQEELSRLANSNKELEDSIQKSRTSFGELEEKSAALQSELKAAKLSAEEQQIREKEQSLAEADRAAESGAKIETLEKEMEKMKNEADCLVGERIKLEEELKMERIAKEKIEQETASAKMEVETMALRYQELEEDFKTWRETAESQKLDMEAKVAELLSSTQAQERDSKGKMEKLQKQILNYEEEMSKLRTDASRLDEAMGALGRMEEELSVTKSELESMTDSKSKLQQELEQMAKELEAVQHNDQLREHTSEIEKLNGLIEQLEKESLDMRQSHHRIDEQLKASESQLEEERVAFQKKEQDMIVKLTEMQNEMRKEADSNEMDKLSQNVQSYQEEVERLHGQISRLETEIAEMTETRERFQQLEQDLNAAREELVLLKNKQDDGNEDEARQIAKAEIEKYQTEMVQVKEEAVTLRKSIEDLQGASSRLAKVEEELSNAQMKEEEARLELEILQEEVAVYKDASDNLTDLEAKLAAKEQEAERVNSELANCLTEVTTLREEVNHLKALNTSLCASQEEAKKEMEDLLEENRLLKEESGKIKTENDDLMAAKTNLEENLKDKQGKICTSQEDAEIRKSELEMKADESETIKVLEDKVREMESELEEKERKLQEAVDERKEMTASLEGSIDELKLDLESKQIELELLKEEYTALKSSSDGGHLGDKKTLLEEKIEELTAERDQLKEDLEESITCSIDAQEELRRTQEALDETKQKLASLEENFQKELAGRKEQEKKTSEDEFSFFTDTIAGLQREKESLTQEKTEKEDLMNLYTEKTTKLEEEVAILNDQLQEKMQEAEATEATVRELQERLDKGEKEYEQLSKEYDEMMKLQEEAEMASSKLMEELEDQKQLLQNATSEIEELQKQAKHQEENSRESELQEKLDQAVDYLEQLNKDYEAEKKKHCQTVVEKEDLEQTLKRKEEDLSSQMKVLKDSLESTNTHYQEEVERRERLEMDLNKLREMNVKLEADLANHRTSSESRQSLAAKEEKKKSEELSILEQSLTEERRLHSETKKVNDELEEKLERYKKEVLAKTERLMKACRSANENHQKAVQERDRTEKLLKEEQGRNEKLLEEMKNERTLSEARQSLATKEDEQKISEKLRIMDQSLIQEKRLHSDAKRLNDELEEKLKSYKKEALSKTEQLMTACKSAKENYRKAVKERDHAEKLLKEEQARNEKLLSEMNERTLSESRQSSAAKEGKKKKSEESSILEQSLIQEKRLHSETKKVNDELEAMIELPDPKKLSKEELVTLVNELGVEQRSHRRQLQQYKQILEDSTEPTSVIHESGVIVSVATLRLKSYNYHLEKENVVVEKKLKKVSELLKSERLKFEEMKGKKEYWKGEYSKMVHGKRKIDCPSISKPLKDNNSPLVHGSPTKRLKESQPMTTSSGPLKQPGKKQATLETADWLDAEMEKLQDQENCTTQ